MTKIVLITGASTGIGRYCAEALVQRGYRVFATARREADLAALEQIGCHAVYFDLLEPESIQSCLNTVLEKSQGKLDILINNSGYGQIGALEDVPDKLLRKQFDVNVFGLMSLTRLVIPIMRQQRSGRIINVSSVLGFISMPYRGAYNASKFAVEALSDALRLELENDNIQVSLIQPGPIESQFRENAMQHSLNLLDIKHSVHKDTYQKMQTSATENPHDSKFTLGPDAVYKKMLHAIESQRSKPRYRVTVITHVLAILKRLLPTRAMDMLMRRAS